MPDAPDAKAPRESMDFDVVIVGAGPAGLAAAIRLKQLAPEISVIIVEKGAELGAHILSGAVVDPIGLDRLLPDWRDAPDQPLRTQVADETFYFLGTARALALPNLLLPKLMRNHGNFVGSLGNLVRWLGARAEALGVDIYPGFAATEVLTNDAGAAIGIATGDMGLGRDGHLKDNFSRGIELRGKYILIAEGARGSLAKELIAKFGLDANREPQKFGIGLKELWTIAPEKHHPGRIEHFFGWPLDNGTGGGGFLYHFDDGLAAIGYVVHLNYRNPNLSPFDEFQRFKTHPHVASILAGGQRLSYGARAITEGGWQSVPKLCFPGGALIGCAAGFVNVPRIKGSHNALLSGMLAAEHVAQALAAGRAHDELTSYEAAWRSSDIGRDLYKVRNAKPLWSNYGTLAGVGLAGLDMWTNELFGLSLFGTLGHGKPDHASLQPISEAPALAYPKPDGTLSFDNSPPSSSRTPIMRRISRSICICAILRSRSRKTCRSMASRRGSIVRPRSMRWSMAMRSKRPIRASSSMRRIASIAKHATSRTRRRTSIGRRRKAAAGRIIEICERYSTVTLFARLRG